MKYLCDQQWSTWRSHENNFIFSTVIIELIIKSSLALLLLFVPGYLFAQLSCGDIINYYDGEEQRYPIIDCDDPFDTAASTESATFVYSINGSSLSEGEVRTVERLPAMVTLETALPEDRWGHYVSLYQKDGADWRLVGGSGEAMVTIPLSATGTYAIVTEVSFPYFGETHNTSGWKKLVSHFIPTVHAQSYRFIRSASIFTVELEIIEPISGASNVLFIPGIMGSRLYEVGDFCDGDSTTAEQELWFSTDECKQLRLSTKFTGESDNLIYTKTNDEGVFDDAFYFVNIYDAFLEQLAEWQDEDVINTYAVFPYDWRLSLDAILKSQYDPVTGKTFSGREAVVTDGLLYKLIAQLAQGAKNGKVTIVTHSNGGLVIKQLMSHLAVLNDPLLQKIDAIVLVAVPQLGSPNSAVGILHGEEIDNVMAQYVTRRLMNTMPFSYHLLPASGYFETVSTPLVTIESGTTTDAWRAAFGESITTAEALYTFLSSESGRPRPVVDDLATPEIVDPLLLEYADTTAAVQSSVTVPSNIRVYQVAGTGVETPSQLTYFTDRTCVSRVLFVCTAYAPKLGYRISMTVDGDATVPVPSALALPEENNTERWWVNLYKYNNAGLFGSSNSDRFHKDLFEIPEISDFIKDILLNQMDDYDYILENSPALVVGDRLVFQLHSPLDLRIVTIGGKVVSSSTNEVPGAVYRRYGELQYLSVPREEGVELVLDGLATGSFTLDIEAVVEGESTVRSVTLSGIPVSTSTLVRVPIAETSDLSEIILPIDYDGNGVVDAEYDESGLILEEVVTYADLYEAINATALKRGPKTTMLALAATAEHFRDKSRTKPKFAALEDKTLHALIKQSILLERLNKLSATEQDMVEGVAQKLIDL